MEWIKETFGTHKPIIAMCHIRALPGDPYFDEKGGMEYIVDMARKEFLALQEGGVDAVMFSNEFSLPYLTKVETVTTACMARVIGELKSEIKIPYGVNMLWDPYASLDLAAATDAKFIREIMSGVYASDYGLWNTDPGAIVRHQMRLGLKDVKLLWNIVPEAAKYLADRDIEQIAKTTVIAKKLVRYHAICSIFTGFIGLTISYLISSKIGAMGACIGTAFATMGNITCLNVVYKKKAGINVFEFYKKCYIMLIPCYGITAIAGLLIAKYVPLDGWIGLGVKAMLIVLVYAIVAFIFYMTKQEKKQLFKRFKKA